MKYVLTIVTMVICLSVATLLPATAPMDMASFLNQADLQWKAPPPSIPGGARIAVLYGDPTKPGPFVMRLSTPGSYTIPPHWHSRAENLTVISGMLYLGDGDKLDPLRAHGLEVGGFHHLPAQTHHYAYTKVPTIVQIHGEGPFDIIYVNPQDDPQNAGRK